MISLGQGSTLPPFSLQAAPRGYRKKFSANYRLEPKNSREFAGAKLMSYELLKSLDKVKKAKNAIKNFSLDGE